MRNYILLMYFGPIFRNISYWKPLRITRTENEDLEKQANNLSSDLRSMRSLQNFTTLLFLFIAAFIHAQDISYGDGKRYILGGLEVTGLQSYNEQTVKTNNDRMIEQ